MKTLYINQIKKLLYALVFISCLGAIAQTKTENYIKTTVYTAPSTQGITANDTLVSLTYFDGLGRPKQSISVSGGAGKLDHNLLPWKRDWTLGSGSTSFFIKNGQTSENQRIMDTNPFGQTAMLWQCVNDAENNGDGGWNTNYFAIDNSVGYRYTVWVKRTGSQDGITYHGTQNAYNLDGTPNATSYFWTGDLPQLNQWYLLVGVVHPHDHAAGDIGLSGVYDMQGNKVADAAEFKWDVTSTTSRFRNYLYYSTDTSVRQYFYNPILQKLDGHEASLEDIIFEPKAPDIVTPVVYDAYGRQTREYLPYTAPTQDGALYADPLTEVENYYNAKYPGTTNPYAEKVLEHSPLGRVMEQGAPGTTWMADNDHSIKFSYDANTSAEVRLYRVNLGPGYVPTLESPRFYDPGTLYKTITKDENWQAGDGNLHTTEEFKDKQGRIVLKRTYNSPPLGEPEGAVAHDTYYVYDKFSNLSFVIPPRVDTSDGVSPEELSELCYQYVYDHRNRLVEKKLPGKQWEYIVYNKLDQPVFSRDQHLIDQGAWMFSKYDKFGRLIYSGFYNSNLSREALQTDLNGMTNLYEAKTNTPTLIDGTDVYYDNSAFPGTDIEILTINYYDTYDFDLNGGIAEDAYGVTPISKPMMLATGNKTRILGTDQWETAVTYYDKKGRAIYTYSRNDYLAVTDKVKHKLSFTGEVLEATTEHIKDGQASITSIEKFSYDHTGRMLKHTHQLAGHPQEVLAENIYDELGQLIQKKTGNRSAAPLQTVDYSYNIRGWLTAINDVNDLQKDLFAFNIRYDDPLNGATALYNGNISETHWRTANTDNSLKNYTYSYDALNRITAATDNTGHYNLSGVTYDKNGNILSLSRQGHLNEAASQFGAMDELVYSYDSGNKLLKVEDIADDTFGFKDDAVNTPDNSEDYSYDLNGNMISDTNKGITSIAYNHLNLPTEIIFNNDPSRKISYIYSADGIKQQKVVNDNAQITTTDYAGGYIYENGSLKFVNHQEGYIEPDGAGGYSYIYQHKDHLGNVRLSYSDSNGDGVVDVNEIIEESNYYPFGLKHRGYNNAINGLPNKYKTFQGVEFEESLGLNLHEMDFRQYDPTLGRFISIDPVTHHSMSPYVAFDNNPVFWVDPSGANAKDPIKETVTSITSRVDEHNVTHITQTTTTATTIKNDDGSITTTYSSGSITNTVDANGNVVEGSTVTTTSGTITRDSEGNISSSAPTTSTREINSDDKTSALSEWTNTVSDYNAKNDEIYNKDMINKTSKHTTEATRAGAAVLSLFGGVDKLISRKLDSQTKKTIGILGGAISLDAVVKKAGSHLNNIVGKNNSYMIVYGVQHVRNGALIKQMKTPSRSSRNPRRTYQGLFKGIIGLFKSN